MLSTSNNFNMALSNKALVWLFLTWFCVKSCHLPLDNPAMIANLHDLDVQRDFGIYSDSIRHCSQKQKSQLLKFLFKQSITIRVNARLEVKSYKSSIIHFHLQVVDKNLLQASTNSTLPLNIFASPTTLTELEALIQSYRISNWSSEGSVIFFQNGNFSLNKQFQKIKINQRYTGC